jgi:hypothetical protein
MTEAEKRVIEAAIDWRNAGLRFEKTGDVSAAVDRTHHRLLDSVKALLAEREKGGRG